MTLIKTDPIISKFFHRRGMSFVYDGNHDIWEDIYVNSKSSAKKGKEKEKGSMVYYDSSDAVFRSIHGRTPALIEESKLERLKR